MGILISPGSVLVVARLVSAEDIWYGSEYCEEIFDVFLGSSCTLIPDSLIDTIV